MADSTKRSIKRTTPEFRVSFPHLFQPHGLEGQEKKFSITGLSDKQSDMSWATSAMEEVLTDKFGPNKANWPKGFKRPVRDGDEKESPIAGYEGNYYWTARSKDKPGVVDAQLQDILDPAQIYAGCYARATVVFFWYEKAGNRGIGMALNNVQKTRDGQPFSGKKAAKDEFAPIEGAAESNSSGGDSLLG